MSGRDDRPEDPDIEAAELVLGLIDGADRARLLANSATDATLAAAIVAWSTRLEPLTAGVAPLSPSPALWARIEASLFPAALPQPQPATVASRGLGAWAWFAAGGYVLAAVFAGALLVSLRTRGTPQPAPIPPRSLVAAPAVVVATLDAPALHVDAPEPPPGALALLTAAAGHPPTVKALVADGSIRLVMLRPVDLPPDREMALWVWPRGTPRPLLLGPLDARGAVLRFPYEVEDGTPIMVTEERRGARTPHDPGPTLLLGELVRPD